MNKWTTRGLSAAAVAALIGGLAFAFGAPGSGDIRPAATNIPAVHGDIAVALSCPNTAPATPCVTDTVEASLVTSGYVPVFQVTRPLQGVEVNWDSTTNALTVRSNGPAPYRVFGIVASKSRPGIETGGAGNLAYNHTTGRARLVPSPSADTHLVILLTDPTARHMRSAVLPGGMTWENLRASGVLGEMISQN